MSPTANRTRVARPQLSLRLMLLLNVIFCVIAGAFYWASRVPTISDELGFVLGTSRSPGGESDRAVHMIFLMFTYTAPLLLAGTLGVLRGFSKSLVRRSEKRTIAIDKREDETPF